MPNLVYHKQTVKKRNNLQSKERYSRKRVRRTVEKMVPPADELIEKVDTQISYAAQRKLDMQMNPKDYRDYLEQQKRKDFKKTAIPDHELVPAIKKELITPVKYNWFEKFILWIKNIFKK